MEVKDLVFGIVSKGDILNLGTYDTDVWVTDVNYVYDQELNLYWISNKNTRHSKAIVEHPRVAATITSGSDPKVRTCLQITGNAEAISPPDEKIIEMYKAKGYPKTPLGGKTPILEMQWYVLRPTRIEMTHEPTFGLIKQVLTLPL